MAQFYRLTGAARLKLNGRRIRGGSVLAVLKGKVDG
jgi:hypothetical protein